MPKPPRGLFGRRSAAVFRETRSSVSSVNHHLPRRPPIMPVMPSDYAYLPASEQELILQHIASPGVYLTPLVVAALLDSLLLGVLVQEISSYYRWFNDGLKFKGQSSHSRCRGP